MKQKFKWEKTGAMTWKQVLLSQKAVLGYAVGFNSKNYGGDKSEFCIFTPNGDLGRFAIFEHKRAAEKWLKKRAAEGDMVRPVKIYVKY
jgi:hypothetical protein